MYSARVTALAAAALLAFLVVAPAVASAQNSLDCQKVWSGPSVNNDVLKCLRSEDRIKGQWRYLVYPGFCALFFVVFLVSFPIVIISVVCCSKAQPGKNAGTSRCCLWMWVVYVLLWGAGMAFLVIFGAKLLETSVPNIIDSTLGGPLHYFNNTGEKIIDFTSNWSSGKRESIDFINLDLSAFTNVSTKVNDFLTDARHALSTYIAWVPIVSYYIGGVCVGLMLLVVASACFRCCVPHMAYCLSCVYWIVGVVCTLLAVVGTVLASLATIACGEVQLQYYRQPGVFQWYLVPYCEEKFKFAEINQEVNDVEKTRSNEACKTLLKSCDNDPLIYPASVSPIRPLLCGNGIASADECPDFESMASVIHATRIKAVTRICPVADQSCTLLECADNCTRDAEKKLAAEILRAAAQANNASIALSYVRPLLDCNFVLDKLLGAMDGCNDLKTGTMMLGTGFFVGGLMFGLAIYIMLRGSRIWDHTSVMTVRLMR
ncbi:hypothetical protein TraAM80_08564 [Trypanosoma rangeli]|uniref:Uncharacterized protein n=1 Tax=Trypanosoma rangeli TaxID=5698 RepID=A0A422N059_TRYRA|nr:uncharacterized protein TraAM80_08564 [Trypanosoma rangeli]RNE98830.1 hypothetical protein TraAM80_08564 [Trypanosoma rangeli]|eukprot:RNE98830.1 hypothetical protein TraAM80_08564 [Trypanosoma rangeli]